MESIFKDEICDYTLVLGVKGQRVQGSNGTFRFSIHGGLRTNLCSLLYRAIYILSRQNPDFNCSHHSESTKDPVYIYI